ncbi:hypothetical protein HanRHA438_Chr09g0402501 [Helianthus annuus]|nr:hypothetical protein HanIR_Chr09g0421571 [Helianthus annuus]KAJ0888483.1 hypothetical protein HanRHA438_Chr09g0402501 [Helianthus annuus]
MIGHHIIISLNPHEKFLARVWLLRGVEVSHDLLEFCTPVSILNSAPHAFINTNLFTIINIFLNVSLDQFTFLDISMFISKMPPCI